MPFGQFYLTVNIDLKLSEVTGSILQNCEMLCRFFVEERSDKKFHRVFVLWNTKYFQSFLLIENYDYNQNEMWVREL